MPGELTATLRETLAAFDGHAVSLLAEARAEFSGQAGYGAALLALLDESAPLIQRAVSWLILEDAKEARAVSPDQMAGIAPRLEGLTDWMAALHLLQVMDHIRAPQSSPEALAGWARRYLTHDRPFLRAWSMSALQRLAAHAPDLRDVAARALSQAAQDPAASVRARARRFTAKPALEV